MPPCVRAPHPHHHYRLLPPGRSCLLCFFLLLFAGGCAPLNRNPACPFSRVLARCFLSFALAARPASGWLSLTFSLPCRSFPIIQLPPPCTPPLPGSALTGAPCSLLLPPTKLASFRALFLSFSSSHTFPLPSSPFLLARAHFLFPTSREKATQPQKKKHNHAPTTTWNCFPSNPQNIVSAYPHGHHHYRILFLIPLLQWTPDHR